jgi:hypothetical protein
MVQAYLDRLNEEERHANGLLRPTGDRENKWGFTGLISISFSAFDETRLPQNIDRSIQFVGLRKRSLDGPVADGSTEVKTPTDLAEEFCESFLICAEGVRANRWKTAIETLENDPLFQEAQLASLLDDPEPRITAQKLFRRLSSGHAITLLTITKLVELVEENTLVLLDEPEGHLHPPLLSAFLRSLSELLIRRNGVAIIATHSPVVLQETPRSCVSILRRRGRETRISRPVHETFGESVGILTHEVFRLEVQRTGFYRLLADEVAKGLSFDTILAEYDGQLGGEARAVLGAMISSRDQKG